MLFINANLDQDLGRVNTLPDGSETVPSLAFQGDGDTGLFRRELNTLSVTAGSAERMHVDHQGITVYGNVTAGNTVVGDFGVTTPILETGMVSSNLVPEANGTLDLGSVDNRWRDLYLAGNSIYLGNAVISEIDGNVTLDAPIQLTTGNATHPSLAHADETSTGVYFEAGGNVVYTANGASTVALESGALVPRASGIDLGSSGNAWANAYVASVTSTGDLSVNSHTVGRGGGDIGTNVAVGTNALLSNTTGVYNSAMGVNAMRSNTTGSRNTAVGLSSLLVNTSGSYNSAIGVSALQSNTTGSFNSAMGVNALYNNTTGSYNSAMGYQALYSNSTGNNNSAMGLQALFYNTTGSSNSAVGQAALVLNTTGSQNTAVGVEAHRNANVATNCVAVGYQALYSNSDGDENVAVGMNALKDSTGGYNTAVGSYALTRNTTAQFNTAVGRWALYYNTTGSVNTAVGFASLILNTTGNSNSAMGVNALYSNTTGSQNSAVGVSAMRSNTTGSSNSAMGDAALFSNTTGSSNSAMGVSALFYNTTGSQNSAMGVNALRLNTTGSQNSAMGVGALYSNTTGSFNSAMGQVALALNTTGNFNSAMGVQALLSNTTGVNNSAMGVNALYLNTTGSLNSAVGEAAMFANTTGSNNSALGKNALRYTTAGGNANYTNTSGLGYDTRCSGNNQVQLGDSNTTTYAFGAVQDRSDRRDKADIEDNTAMGLAFVEKLRPVTFRWDYRDSYLDPVITAAIDDSVAPALANGAYPTPLGTVTVTDGTATLDCTETWETEEDVPDSLEVGGIRLPLRPDTRLVAAPKDGSRKRTRLHHGMIAQEVEAALTDLGLDTTHFGGLQHHSHNGGEDVWSLGYTEFVGPLIKAVQELKALCDTQSQDITDLRAENASIRARLDALE